MSKKLQEKQQRRLEQERRQQERRRAARRRNYVTIGVAALVALVVVVLVVLEKDPTEELAGTSPNAAGCDDVQEIEPEGRNHVQDGTDVQYGTTPPTSGDHYATPANTGFYTAPLQEEQVVHNLEHSQIVIWYRPDAPPDVIDDIETLVEDERVATLATPYDQVPGEFNFVLTAWGAMQACERVSGEVVNDFRRAYQGQGPEKIAPPFNG
ncbi:MAG: DUF3105 domain-containing protein [Actinomycetota bacterium]